MIDNLERWEAIKASRVLMDAAERLYRRNSEEAHRSEPPEKHFRSDYDQEAQTDDADNDDRFSLSR